MGFYEELKDYARSRTSKDYSTVTDLCFPTQTPFLTFVYSITTHLLGSNVKPLSPQQKLIHRIIFKLKSQGYDFKQISDTLNKHNIRTFTGKKFYRSLVWNIYKKRLKKNEFMNQPIVKGYRDFDIVFVERY